MATSQLRTTPIHGKQYVEVNERLKYFRSHFAGYSLISELISVTEKTALIRAVISDKEGRVVATGTAFERADNALSKVNKTSHVENCETSAWGRALGNFGIGIDGAVASADEVLNAIAKQDATPKSAPPPAPIVKSAAPAKASVPSAVTPVSPAQMAEIEKLAKELGMDTKKDIYAKMKIATPNAAQSDAILKRLRDKLTKELDDVAKKNS